MLMMRFAGAVVLLAVLAGCGEGDRGLSRGSASDADVMLYHCGVSNVMFDGQEWEVENDPFDATTAPGSFTGFGVFARRGDVLTFEDDGGTTLNFTRWDGTPDPFICQ